MNQNNDDLRKLKSILEEKERNLLLSASIGKELLDKNTKLEDKIIDLQTELRGANENLEQISYQLNQKNDLINILTSDDECRSENGETWTNEHKMNHRLTIHFTFSLQQHPRHRSQLT
jgi:trafficking kinesin-binding protein 1